MSVSVTVIDVDRATKTLTVEAWQGTRRIMRSPVKYTTLKKKNIEQLIRKGCKAFDSPVWGGFNIIFQVDIQD